MKKTTTHKVLVMDGLAELQLKSLPLSDEKLWDFPAELIGRPYVKSRLGFSASEVGEFRSRQVH